MEVVDVFDHPALERARHADVVDDRQVLDELAQPDAAGMGTDRHAELGRHEQDSKHLVDSAEARGVDLAHADRVGLEELLEHHPVVDVLAGRDADRGERPGDRRVAEDVVGARRLLDPVRVELGERPHPLDRDRHVPALVRVDREHPVRPDLGTDHRRPPAVVVEIRPDLHLEPRPAVGQRLAAEPPICRRRSRASPRRSCRPAAVADQPARAGLRRARARIASAFSGPTASVM